MKLYKRLLCLIPMLCWSSAALADLPSWVSNSSYSCPMGSTAMKIGFITGPKGSMCLGSIPNFPSPGKTVSFSGSAYASGTTLHCQDERIGDSFKFKIIHSSQRITTYDGSPCYKQ